MAEARSASPTANVYTVLLLIAALALLAGVGYVWYRYADMFGTSNPFAVPEALLLPGLGLA